MILNLTQHIATAEQVDAGVIDLPEAARIDLIAALTADELQSPYDVRLRAEAICRIAQEHRGLHNRSAMIGGAPWLMAALDVVLRRADIMPLYAFSKRTSVESPDLNGVVRKCSEFRHVGFIRAPQVLE